MKVKPFHVVAGFVVIGLVIIAYMALMPRPTDPALAASAGDESPDGQSRTQRTVAGVGGALSGLATAIAGAA